jgi:dihydrofolate synthase/folylpolyglutamate synthase
LTYGESISWLFSTQLFGVKLGLEGPQRLMRKFLAFPRHTTRVIHVAGTNGKGSVCAMIDSVARTAGWRTGLFTSPHLVDFRERIRVSGCEISEDAAAAALTELRKLCESLDPHPTFFEIATALALRHFRDRECELVILETGMGGRLDATTTVPADVCAITPIGLDHQQWLGDTIEEIAAEKAGIMVKGKPTISAPQMPEAQMVLEEQANETRSPLRFIEEPLRGYSIGLPGPHQTWNAALALEALHSTGVPLNYDIVQQGLAMVRWPGRFETIAPEGGRPAIVLDGAHNAAAAEALVAAWNGRFGERRCTLVFSALAGKDTDSILASLAPLAERIHFCPLKSRRAMPLDDLPSGLPADAPPHELFPTASEAFDAALARPAPVLVAGSLFLVGEIRARLTGADHHVSAQ